MFNYVNNSQHCQTSLDEVNDELSTSSSAAAAAVHWDDDDDDDDAADSPLIDDRPTDTISATATTR